MREFNTDDIYEILTELHYIVDNTKIDIEDFEQIDEVIQSLRLLESRFRFSVQHLEKQKEIAFEESF